MEVAVSFLKNKLGIEKTIEKINQSKADYLHVDLMDGIFVKEKNYPDETIHDYLKKSKKALDIHLMIDSPINYLEKLISLNPKTIYIHLESKNLKECLNILEKNHIRKGIAINPDTDITKIIPYLPLIDVVLVMSVYPGVGGQTFLDKNLSKLEELKKYQEKYPFLINIDGGINNLTITKVKYYVNMVVSGSYVCLSDNYDAQINSLRG